jgi:hypothetical protein
MLIYLTLPCSFTLIFYFIFFLVVVVFLGFELIKVLCLLGKYCTWAMPLVPFALVIFSDRASLFALDQPYTEILLLMPLAQLELWGWATMYNLLLRWDLTNFLPSLAMNHNPSHLRLPSSHISNI